MVTSRDSGRAEAPAIRLGPSAVPRVLDVRDERSVGACVDRARAEWGGLDMLVNNARIGMRTVNPRLLSEPLPFWEVPPAGFRDVMETKVLGGFLVARAVVPVMLRDGGGRVVNISMNEETMVRRGFVPYGPAGAGVEALSRVMAGVRRRHRCARPSDRGRRLRPRRPAFLKPVPGRTAQAEYQPTTSTMTWAEPAPL